MKKFETPVMTMIKLPQDNVIATSPILCDANMCYGFDCPDCPTICGGIYHCEVFKCKTY